jgi:hypothetical protein
MPLNYVKAEKIILKDNPEPELNENWVESLIVDDPAILGLGDLDVKDRQRSQPRAGRLDILLRDPETDKRYEIELMLGSLDESHIIRAIEYWDIERRRYPQYDHVAVIIAEDITSRFLNVINLLNGSIPLIAIQMNALKIDSQIILYFTKVLDEVIRGSEEEDNGEEANRPYWEKKGSKSTLEIVDACLEILREIDPSLNLKYNKFYIGLISQSGVNNFVVFRARKQYVLVYAYGLDANDKLNWHKKFEDAKIALLSDDSYDAIRFKLKKDEFQQNRQLIKDLFTFCYNG